jgi:salicylate hydroxylase
MQSINSVFCDNRSRVLLLGDAAHATVPTLGQGATSAIEDSIFSANILSIIDSPNFNNRIPELVLTIANKRTSRANFVSQISIEASMHLTSGKSVLKLENEIQNWRQTDSQFRRKYQQLMQNYPKSINFDSDSYKVQNVA